MLQIWGRPALNDPKTLVADQIPQLLRVMCCKGQPALNDSETLDADLRKSNGVDVLQIWGDPRRAMTESPLSLIPDCNLRRLMCCKIRATNAQCLEGSRRCPTTASEQGCCACKFGQPVLNAHKAFIADLLGNMYGYVLQITGNPRLKARRPSCRKALKAARLRASGATAKPCRAC